MNSPAPSNVNTLLLTIMRSLIYGCSEKTQMDAKKNINIKKRW